VKWLAGEIGFVNVLQPHTPLTDSEADIKATELADAIHTHWLYDPVLKGTYPADLLAQTQALWGTALCAPAMTRCCVTTAATLSA
jgi:6-phospho-beta-glucosidase